MYLYLGIRDAAYLQLHDQNTALVAAAELSARKALSTQNTLEPLLRRFGLNGTTDLVGVQRMRRAMLDLDSSAPDPALRGMNRVRETVRTTKHSSPCVRT